MASPRNDQAELDRQCDEHDTCPTWWACDTRGCYEDARARYADGAIKREQARGYPDSTIKDDGNNFLRAAHGRKWR